MSRMVSSSGSGSASSRARVPNTMAGVEYPDCMAPVAAKAAWMGWSDESVLSDSTVVTECPSAWAARITSLLANRPSRSTAEAPVSPEAEPNRTLTIPSRRRTLNRLSWTWHSRVRLTPLSSRVISIRSRLRWR